MWLHDPSLLTSSLRRSSSAARFQEIELIYQRLANLESLVLELHKKLDTLEPSCNCSVDLSPVLSGLSSLRESLASVSELISRIEVLERKLDELMSLVSELRSRPNRSKSKSSERPHLVPSSNQSCLVPSASVDMEVDGL